MPLAMRFHSTAEISGMSSSLPASVCTIAAMLVVLYGFTLGRDEPGGGGPLVELGDDALEDLGLGLGGADEVRVGPREALERLHRRGLELRADGARLRDLEEAVAALVLQRADTIGDLGEREARREQQLLVGDRLGRRAAQRCE